MRASLFFWGSLLILFIGGVIGFVFFFLIEKGEPNTERVQGQGVSGEELELMTSAKDSELVRQAEPLETRYLQPKEKPHALYEDKDSETLKKEATEPKKTESYTVQASEVLSNIIHFTFLELGSEKKLAGVEVAISCGIEDRCFEKSVKKTDLQGSIDFKTIYEGALDFQFRVDGYKAETQALELVAGENTYVVRLAKDSTIAIRLGNKESKKPKSLFVDIILKKSYSLGSKGYSNSPEVETVEVSYEPTQGVYLWKKIPAGIVYARFHAPGFKRTPFFTFTPEPDREIDFTLYLEASQKILIDLAVSEKPLNIYLVKEVIYKDSDRKEIDTSDIPYPSTFERLPLNKGGYYSYELQEMGVYSFVIYAPGYLKKTFLFSSKKVLYKLGLEERGLETMFVQDYMSKQPIADAVIRYSFGGEHYSMITNAIGAAVVKDLPYSVGVDIEVTHTDYGKSKEHYYSGEFMADSPFTMLKKYEVSGTISFEGKPIKGAQVRVKQAAFFPYFAVTYSDEKGYYRLAGLEGTNEEYAANGSHSDICRVEAFHKDYGWKESGKIWFDGRSHKIDLQFDKTYGGRVSFFLDDGTTIAGLKGSIYSLKDRTYKYTFDCGEGNDFLLSRVEPGDYYVALESENYVLGSTILTMWGEQDHSLYVYKVQKIQLEILMPDKTPYIGAVDVLGYPRSIFSDFVRVVRQKNDRAFCYGYYFFSFVLFNIPNYGIDYLRLPEKVEETPKVLQLSLAPREEFRIKVTDEAGEPLEGALVIVNFNVTTQLFLGKFYIPFDFILYFVKYKA